MATYNNQHWLLTHIRNSFISTDDTGMCEAVMLSDDLPKQFLRAEHSRRCAEILACSSTTEQVPEHISYPGLDQSDDEDMDLTSQSYDIQMYPEIGAHRYRSMTAQKLEKMDQARRKAARVKSIKFDDFIPNDDDKEIMFARKKITLRTNRNKVSFLTEALAHAPKQVQNKFLQYARFDGTSQTGVATKNLNIFLTMLPDSQRNYPIKICVTATAKILEVIGFICYKCTIINSEIPLHSVRNYGLYITEEDGEIDLDFPPLDLREPCSKFGFTHLALAERRQSAHITRVDYRSLSMTSETEPAGETSIGEENIICNNQSDRDMDKMIGHNSMIEAPVYRTYRVNILSKGFFKSEVQLGISGERIEIDPVQQKNSKFWARQKAISYNIETIAYCERLEQKNNKAVIRLWYLNLPSSSNASGTFHPEQPYGQSLTTSHSFGTPIINSGNPSPQHFNTNPSLSNFKYYDFETDTETANQIYNKVNFILDVRSSVSRREFLSAKGKKRDKLIGKKALISFAI
uniref:Putative stress-activated map kinase-interacting protein 1 n=1 Tax=Tabanus bromius TaxID=304241 RepID=A0A0K8TMX3_TABBR